MEKFQFLSSCENGFRPGKSTESLCIVLLEYKYYFQDSQKYVGGFLFKCPKHLIVTLEICITIKEPECYRICECVIDHRNVTVTKGDVSRKLDIGLP